MDVIFRLDEIDNTAVQLLSLIKEKKVIAFHGEMGAGKTTLIRAICHALGIKDMVSSPTFSIINEYKTPGNSSLYHIDLYRLRNAEEAIAAGVEDCLHSGKICLVEWPEKAPRIFPEDSMHWYLISTGNNERKLQINL